MATRTVTMLGARSTDAVAPVAAAAGAAAGAGATVAVAAAPATRWFAWRARLEARLPWAGPTLATKVTAPVAVAVEGGGDEGRAVGGPGQTDE